MTPQELQSVKQRFGIVGNSPLLNHAIQIAVQVAPTDMTVLITGESGTGKESFSKIIHQLSARKHGQFIAVNCGAIPEGTIDSELFGHEKGAFTGATEARKGYFEVTDGGTIFLDEVGEMPLGTQARLLRVLENGEYIRVGSSKVQKTNVRVVAATNVNLIHAVEHRKFREDLYYRLNTVPITVPPLRERGDDIYLLFRMFASNFSEKYKTEPIRLTKEAQLVLSQYRFPGNIRQLKNIVEQMSILEMQREIDAETLRRYLPDYGKTALSRIASRPYDSSATAAADSGLTDRDILFKILFDLKKDFNELKSMFLELVHNPTAGEQILSKHKDLFVAYEPKNQEFTSQEAPIVIDHAARALPPTPDAATVKVEDISHELADESLSIFEKEKDLIIKALRKHNGKRRPAAEELGISERTLYRKLKEYDLEHL